MNIDWFTFIAQIVNFLILLALLKRFLYGPILKAIAEREAQIASRFEQADAQQTAAESARRSFDERVEELAHTRQQILASAADEVEVWKSDRLAEAKTEVEESRGDWFGALDRERDQLRADLLEQYQRDGLRLAEGVLQWLTGQDCEELMIDAFISRLKDGELKHIPSEIGEPVTVRSAFELTHAQEGQLQAELETLGFRPDTIQFHVDESLICGIEVRTRDHEISWNARESLDWLAAEFTRDLDQTLATPDRLPVETEASHAT